MRIGIIDADLIFRPRHRFPNLACMKMAGFYKKKGDQVKLVYDYEKVGSFDKLYLSKVFTDTCVPCEILQLSNLTYGGTGFFYENAPELPAEIEHSIPDYSLYDEYI